MKKLDSGNIGNLGGVIEGYRIGMGISRAEMCRRCGVSYISYWRYLRGGSMSVEDVVGILWVLRVGLYIVKEEV